MLKTLFVKLMNLPETKEVTWKQFSLLYKYVDEGMIKRMKQLWVASELPIAPYCVLEKCYFIWGFESSEGISLSRDILFPEGKMFLSLPLCPGALLTALETMKTVDVFIK